MWELFELGRYAEAEKELRRSIAGNPDDGQAHAMLAVCLNELERHEEALESAKKAVSLAPESDFTHSTLARTYISLDRNKEAFAPAREALRLDPNEASNYGLMASLYYEDKDFEKALEMADIGLEIDAESASCQNLRGLALAKLGRADEAAENMDSALALDPESSLGHTSKGWVLVQQGDYKGAEASFREALRLDAENEWARDGMAETLKARNIFYRGLLRWQLWMSTLRKNHAWAVLIGLYVAQRLLRALAKAYPEAAPFVLPFLIVYFLFALWTWFGDPIANLLLRFHKLGRFLLTKNQVQASNWFAGMGLFGVLFLVTGAVAGDAGLAATGLILIMLGLLSAIVLSAERLRRSPVMRVFLGGMVVAGLLAVLLPMEQGAIAGGAFMIGVFAFSWIANAISLR